jgi:hypothetical protein
VYSVTVESPRVSPAVEIGEIFAMQSPRLPVAGLQWLTVIGASRLAARTSLTCELIVPINDQKFDLVSRTVAGDITQLASVEIDTTGAESVFTIRDAAGKLLVNARVSLDSGVPKKTDSSGQVRFLASPGQHKLYVEAPGNLPIELLITV